MTKFALMIKLNLISQYSNKYSKRVGAIYIEFLLNFFIYLLIFIFLFSFAIIPLQLFYLKSAARDAAVVYSQLAHFSIYPDNVSFQIQTMLGETFPKGYKPIQIDSSSKVRDDIASIISQYIDEELTKKGTLQSLLFDESKISIMIEDSGKVAPSDSFLSKVGTFLQNFIYTSSVKITIKYQLSLLEVIDLKLFKYEASINGVCIVRYNP